jgi:hypothetical protein
MSWVRVDCDVPMDGRLCGSGHAWAWPAVIVRAKKGQGTVSTIDLSPRAMAHLWGPSVEAWDAALSYFHSVGLLVAEGDDVIVAGWDEYQRDLTGAERQRVSREKKRHVTSRDVTRQDVTVTNVTADSTVQDRTVQDRTVAAVAATTTVVSVPPPPSTSRVDPRQQRVDPRQAARAAASVTAPAGAPPLPPAYSAVSMSAVPPPPPPQHHTGSVTHLDPALVQQVMSLTPLQIQQLPPDKRQSILQLRQQITGSAM